MGSSASVPVRNSDASVQSSGSGKMARKKKMQPLGSDTKNAKLVLDKWCDALNRHDIPCILRFASPASCCFYKGALNGMPLRQFLEASCILLESFPDNHMRWDSVTEVEPGLVVVKNFVGKGTHTGKPYSFGPYPPIAATGKVVQEDPCHLEITVKRGKMTKFVIDTYCGDLVGPPGYYEKIGGKLKSKKNTEVVSRE